jgi:polygalacturonase
VGGRAAVVLELPPGSRGARLTNAIVARNRFSNFDDASLQVGASGDDGVFENVVIENNFFTATRWAVEIGAGRGNRISGLVIGRNHFHGNRAPITIFAARRGASALSSLFCNRTDPSVS